MDFQKIQDINMSIITSGKEMEERLKEFSQLLGHLNQPEMINKEISTAFSQSLNCNRRLTVLELYRQYLQAPTLFVQAVEQFLEHTPTETVWDEEA